MQRLSVLFCVLGCGATPARVDEPLCVDAVTTTEAWPPSMGPVRLTGRYFGSLRVSLVPPPTSGQVRVSLSGAPMFDGPPRPSEFVMYDGAIGEASAELVIRVDMDGVTTRRALTIQLMREHETRVRLTLDRCSGGHQLHAHRCAEHQVRLEPIRRGPLVQRITVTRYRKIWP